MFVLIWAALLFSVRGNNAGTGASTWGRQHCNGQYCVTLSEQELTAEAGLCVLIPCSFMTADVFKPKHVVWFKCEATKKTCSNADIIFHSDRNTDKKPQSGFEGRVSLLEPDVSQKNCSIIINDLKESDSGSYQLRVTAEGDGWTFIPRVTVSVKGLIEKPTVTIPTLTEGQQATLTCTAPGLCSGSVPEITWTWRGAGGTESHITDNITAVRTENVTTFTQRHVSALTFDPSPKYHNTNVTCKIHFKNKTTTEETSALKVNYVKKVQITGVTSVREGEGLNLTCSVESFPPALIVWSKLGSDTNLHDDSGSSTLVIQNVTAEHAGQYICTAEYMNNTLKDEANITVIYKRKPQILGNTTVKEGDVLNLTCSVESFPPALIVWKNHSFNTNHNDTGSSTLVIHNVTAEHAGQYSCTAKHLDTTETLYTNVTVNYLRTLQIIGNTTVKEGDALNLTCSVESFPPVLIVWKKTISNTYLHNGTNIDLYDNTGSATLVIPNVTEGRSGEYICTAKHLDTTVTTYVDVTVTYSRTPQIIGNTTVKEGDVLNLTCSVESVPRSLIAWKQLSSNTILHNDTGSAALVIQNVTAEHAGQYICTANYMNNTLKDEASITVIYKRKPQILGNTTVKEGDVLNLTCSVESFPPALIVWKNHSFNTNHNDTGSSTLVIHNVTVEHAGQYSCTAKHLDTTETLYTNVTVNYLRTLQIIGNTTVKEGDALNLTCSVESFPLVLIVWKQLSSNTNLHNDSGSAALVIPNVTADHSGEYICTAKHLDTTVTTYVNVTVTWLSKIQGDSGCVLQSEVLTCVCISEGFPLPTIKWPLLKNHTKYSIITTVSNHTVNSTVSLTVKNHGNSTVECVSNNGNGEEIEKLLIHKNVSEKHVPLSAEQSSGFRLGSLRIIIAFLSGALLSAIICLAKSYYRKKLKSSRNSVETSEMEIRREDKLVYYGQALQDHRPLNLSSRPTEVVYANIDFSLLKRNCAREATRRQESTKTEYAEIKKALKEEWENDAVEEEEIFCAKEEKLMVELEMKQCEPENKGGGEEAVYATVNDVIDEI